MLVIKFLKDTITINNQEAIGLKNIKVIFIYSKSLPVKHYFLMG